jgi:hypothetical protein
MAALFGMFHPRIAWADRICSEFDVYGDFRCDLAVGEWGRAAYCFIEFEDARKDSIFEKRRTRATREWGKRFDHGYSQIIDWCHKLDGLTPGADLLARFGHYEITFEAILVIGREAHLDPGEKQRLGWRRDKVTVNTKKVICLTFDDLLGQFETRLATLTAAAEAAAIRSARGKGTKKRAAKGDRPPRPPGKGKS